MGLYSHSYSDGDGDGDGYGDLGTIKINSKRNFYCRKDTTKGETKGSPKS